MCLNIPVVQAHPDDFHHSAGQCSQQNMKRAKCHLLQLLVVSKSVADHDGTLHQFQKQSATVFFMCKLISFAAHCVGHCTDKNKKVTLKLLAYLRMTCMDFEYNE